MNPEDMKSLPKTRSEAEDGLRRVFEKVNNFLIAKYGHLTSKVEVRACDLSYHKELGYRNIVISCKEHQIEGLVDAAEKMKVGVAKIAAGIGPINESLNK